MLNDYNTSPDLLWSWLGSQVCLTTLYRRSPDRKALWDERPAWSEQGGSNCCWGMSNSYDYAK
ncbi:MAG: hypothetical protein LBG17_05110 [Bacteroidales bacterium]|jgi:hypothetical protein|nr:hypothetical protein [Bacteroidales bacterium]